MLKVYQKYLVINFIFRYINISLIFLSLIFILNILEEISFFKDLEVSMWQPYFLTLLNSPIILFEIFPFIFLLTTIFFFQNLFNRGELELLKKNGLSNVKVIMILFIVSFMIGIFNIGVYYNLSSKLKFHYSNIKNKLSNDNKYLAMVTESGLWIKDEINDKKFVIKSNYISENFLFKSVINEFNKDFELLRTIQSEKIDIQDNIWKIYEPIITKNNSSNNNVNILELETNFNEEKINNLFSNISTLDIVRLFNLKNEYKKLGYSSDDIDIHLLKLFTLPLFYGILTILSSILMFYLSNKKSLLFSSIIGILLSISIYYMNFIFSSLGSNGNIPIILSILFPLFIVSIISIIGMVNINEK